jgi:hypothetical protein
MPAVNPCTLSIGIVTFDSEKYIAKAIESIVFNLPSGFPTQIVCVDNHSSDSTVSVLEKHTLKILNLTCIHNSFNLGFARAHNQALAAVASSYHIICNPDVIVKADIFTPLFEFMEARPEIGMCCPQFLNPDGTLQHLNRRPPTVLDLFLRRFVPETLKPFFNKRLKSYDMQDVGYEKSCDVPFVSGAFMFCRSQVLKELGGFDERFFLYFEDADLSRRMQNHGYRTVYFPEVNVTHAWERLAHKSLHGSLLFAHSAFRYFRKWGFQWW